jgi:hypothetical protein
VSDRRAGSEHHTDVLLTDRCGFTCASRTCARPSRDGWSEHRAAVQTVNEPRTGSRRRPTRMTASPDTLAGMAPLRINLAVTFYYRPDGTYTTAVHLEAEPSTPFRSALESELGSKGLAFSKDSIPFVVFPSGPIESHTLMAMMDRTTTFADLQQVFGKSTLTAEPPLLAADDGGRGGGFLDTFIHLVEGGLELSGYISAGAAITNRVIAARYRRRRSLAHEWDASDEISMELRQAVLSESVWDRSEFDKNFALSVHRGSELLKQLGFSRVRGGRAERWRWKEM